MAAGDQADMLARLKAQLPRWFDQHQSPTPVLDAALSGAAWVLSFIHGLATYANLQVRVSTAIDGWLDLIAGDFANSLIRRRPGQTDSSFRDLLLASLIRERSTRAALRKILLDMTGREPVITEPYRTDDMAVWDMPGFYNSGYRYGALGASYVVFVDAYRPLPGSQWDGTTDAALFAAAESVRPVGATIYMRLNAATPGSLPVLSVIAMALVGSEDFGPANPPVVSISSLTPASSVEGS